VRRALTTGHVVDVIEGIRVTCIDNGMPVVCLKAEEVGLSGYEDPLTIESNREVCEIVERVRLGGGPLMNLATSPQRPCPRCVCSRPRSTTASLVREPSSRNASTTRSASSCGVGRDGVLIPGSVAYELADAAALGHDVSTSSTPRATSR